MYIKYSVIDLLYLQYPVAFTGDRGCIPSSCFCFYEHSQPALLNTGHTTQIFKNKNILPFLKFFLLEISLGNVCSEDTTYFLIKLRASRTAVYRYYVRALYQVFHRIFFRAHQRFINVCHNGDVFPSDLLISFLWDVIIIICSSRCLFSQNTMSHYCRALPTGGRTETRRFLKRRRPQQLLF